MAAEEDSERPRRGRPVALGAGERRERILDALAEVFRESGMSGTTMAAVARRAGMSKRTVYEVFDDRAALFAAYLSRLRHEFVQPLDDAARALPLEERLRRLLAPRAYASSFDLPLAVLRAMIAEGPERPDMARTFLAEGPGAIRELIRAELDRAVARGEATIADTGAAAALLADMIRPSPLDVLIDPASLPGDAAIQARFDLAIRVFLRGVADGPAAT
ncbi:TetR/AcrR family transcriptional regulator [Rubellimicrobium aerolatum]|uniref:TetR/AcrR family transcriptional regulator n=1 Tax=Rubellimicrobium aerolatum TaxID=490979 RepID=A0ABW0SCY1_9RHOB|nr:TetR/AcrR family transcriptional regulator [Rubellimicrobium aerolatum]MBP1806182.1 AcrR family transcriptional regulator [Rubellimicrobium aerolatum]